MMTNNPDSKVLKQESIDEAAQIWCDPRAAHIEMDATICRIAAEKFENLRTENERLREEHRALVDACKKEGHGIIDGLARHEIIHPGCFVCQALVAIDKKDGA